MNNLNLEASREFPTANFSIRDARVSDIGAMALLLERAVAGRSSQPLPDIASDEDKLADLHIRMAHPRAWAYLAYDVDMLVGFALGHPSIEDTSADPDTDYLALLMVEPNYWGTGAGSQLLDAAAESARNKGKRHLLLWTAKTNDRARKLYERKGYYLTNKQKISPVQGPLEQYRLDLSQ